MTGGATAPPPKPPDPPPDDPFFYAISQCDSEAELLSLVHTDFQSSPSLLANFFAFALLVVHPVILVKLKRIKNTQAAVKESIRNVPPISPQDALKVYKNYLDVTDHTIGSTDETVTFASSLIFSTARLAQILPIDTTSGVLQILGEFRSKLFQNIDIVNTCAHLILKTLKYDEECLEFSPDSEILQLLEPNLNAPMNDSHHLEELNLDITDSGDVPFDVLLGYARSIRDQLRSRDDGSQKLKQENQKLKQEIQKLKQEIQKLKQENRNLEHVTESEKKNNQSLSKKLEELERPMRQSPPQKGKKKKTQDKTSSSDSELDSEDPSLEENFNHKEPSYSEATSPYRNAILYEDSIRVKLDDKTLVLPLEKVDYGSGTVEGRCKTFGLCKLKPTPRNPTSKFYAYTIDTEKNGQIRIKCAKPIVQLVRRGFFKHRARAVSSKRLDFRYINQQTRSSKNHPPNKENRAQHRKQKFNYDSHRPKYSRQDSYSKNNHKYSRHRSQSSDEEYSSYDSDRYTDDESPPPPRSRRPNGERRRPSRRH